MRVTAAALRLSLVLAAALAACGDDHASDPCASPDACALPPAPRCDGDTLVVTADATCSANGGVPDCHYAETRTDCGATGMTCAAGACHPPGDPCIGQTCATPPASTCNNNLLTSYDATGTCDAPGGTPECHYAAHVTDCKNTGKICVTDACVDPSTVCAGVTCDHPPADSCTNNTRHHYPATGTCDGSSGTPVCKYTPTDTDCTASDAICAAGACVDPCA